MLQDYELWVLRQTKRLTIHVPYFVFKATYKYARRYRGCCFRGMVPAPIIESNLQTSNAFDKSSAEAETISARNSCRDLEMEPSRCRTNWAIRHGTHLRHFTPDKITELHNYTAAYIIVHLLHTNPTLCVAPSDEPPFEPQKYFVFTVSGLLDRTCLQQPKHRIV